MPKSFYITTTLPYVNSDPHVGFATEIIRADVIARHKKSLGFEVFFNTGTDEHGQKLYESAEKAGKDVQDYVDEYAAKFKGLIELLNLSKDIHFIRTTDKNHEESAKHFWELVNKNGYIYKKNYKTKYCVGCESEKTDSELVNDKCVLHPDRDLEMRDEENYFFKFSAFQEKLLKYYEEYPDFVIPNFRMNEMREFVKGGLEDFSISRLSSKMSWGIPVPNDSLHVMYVWFDALTNYISTLGWPEDNDTFDKFWTNGTPVQYCGKDNTRFQSVMWQAMLMAANLPQSRHIIVNGFINSGGQKMSKSLGNVISPYDIVSMFEQFAGELKNDVLRYYLLRHVNSFEDSDMTIEGIKEAYQANLANGLGNLVSRVMTLSEKYCESSTQFSENINKKVTDNIENFDLQKAMNNIWDLISNLDATIQAEKPFSVVKTDLEVGKQMISRNVVSLYEIAISLVSLMPQTSATIIELIKSNKKPDTPLFNRLT